jgi:hypothetical protein
MEFLARSNGLGRAAIGAALIAAPALVTQGWLGDDARTDAARVLGRALGARDAALGLGLVQALSSGGSARPWLQAAALADAVDASATLLAWKRLPPAGRAGVLALAAGSAVQCALLATRLK